MDEVKILKDHIPILLAHYFKHKSEPLRVFSPMYGIDLFSITKDLEIEGVISDAALSKARDSCLSRAPEVGTELPHHNDLRNAFVSAGCIRESSWKGEFQRLWKHVSSSADPLVRPNPVYVAPDTNVLYGRVFSRHIPLLRKAGLEMGEFSYVLSEAVVGEIDAGISKKYVKKDLDSLSRATDWKGIVKLGNRGVLRTRRAKLAQNEVHYLRGEKRALKCDAQEHPREKEAGDIVIAESYARFAGDSKVDVFLVTGDQDMADHAANQGLSCMLLNVAHKLPRSVRPDPWTIQCLIHDVAVLFGAVRLKGTGALVWGEYPGKGTQDYRREALKIELDPSARTTAPFLRDLNICLGIWKP